MRWIVSLPCGLLLFLLSLSTHASEWQLNMTEGVTSISKEVYSLHMLIFWICCAIGVVVFGVMFVSMFLHRKSRGVKSANFHESTVLEIIWTTIPFIILIAMAFPATKNLIDIYDTEDADIEILITGYQWKWRYDYPADGVSYFSNLSTPLEQIYKNAAKNQHYLLEVDNALVIPAGKKVRLLVTAADVIHSWWVPDLAVKRDAIPGFINEAWTKVDKIGTYRGQCAELCGKDHGFMPIEVKVVSQQDYELFIQEKKKLAADIAEAANQQFDFDELYRRGESVYQQHCATCHQLDGKGLGIFPAIAGSPIATGPVKEHLNRVLNGAGAMPAFGEQLSPVESAAVVTFQRNAFGNNMGELVQPIDIVEFKQGR
ncbi:cytochrome c oxidase subunit II [Agaribacterium haliotis]|uniref:cytochrome c oxidase subunit II n=1 Tax=Agaribacterium haliotis TaxID=2013869 RepID=UPI000BB58F6F|nr:cytochrome c oxidase subunit II [Agaribacterium haliotis]